MELPALCSEYLKKSIELVLSGLCPKVRRNFTEAEAGNIARLTIYRVGNIVRCDIQERIGTSDGQSTEAINLILGL